MNSSRLRLRVVVESFFIVARAGLLTLEISNALVRLFVLLGWRSMSTETLNMKGLLWQWAPRTKHGSRCTFEVRTQGLFDLFVFSISFEVGTRVLWCWLEDFLPATFGNGHVSDMVVRSRLHRLTCILGCPVIQLLWLPTPLPPIVWAFEQKGCSGN